MLSGNELLDGLTADTNGAFLCADLSSRGVKVLSALTVADERGRLCAALRFSLAAEPDLLVVSGGLGTTHDDLTAVCLAEALGVGLEEHPEALRLLEEKVRLVTRRRGLLFDDVFAGARGQALLPAGATPVPPAGVAPGIATRRGRTRVFALPGVPGELEVMWRGIAETLAAEGLFPEVTGRTVRIYGVGELQVAPLLDQTRRDLVETSITVGGGEVTVRLRYRREAAAHTQAEAVVAALVAGAPVFSVDGRSVDDMVADSLRAAGRTVAVAESCTGGLLGARLTSRPGSSDHVLGGIIAYGTQVKVHLLRVPAAMLAQYGAVSEEVAAAMAEGARAATGADFGLGVSGVAGPGGGTSKKPVGLVFVACAGPHGTSVVRGWYPGDRRSVREHSVTAALHLLREALGAA